MLVELPRLVGATVLIFVFSMGQKVSKIIVGNGRPSIERQRRMQTIAHTTDIEIRVGAARKPVVQRRRCGETRSMLSSWTRVLRAMCGARESVVHVLRKKKRRLVQKSGLRGLRGLHE